MTNPPEHKLRWYQYKLSSLFILTILVCLASSWYATVMHNAAKRRATIAEIIELGGHVWYYDASKAETRGEPPSWYSWLRKLHCVQRTENVARGGLKAWRERAQPLWS